MKRLYGLLVIFTLHYANSTHAQFSLSADISPRTELRHGYRVMPNTDDKAAFLTHQRSRIISDFKSKKLNTRISFQDVRVWGQEAQKQPIPSLAIHEAWAELLLSDSLALKIGRQEFFFDNQRFFAKNDWVPQGQKHDMVSLRHLSSAGELTLAMAFNQPWAAFGRNFATDYGINNYKYLSVLRFFTKPTNNLSMSFSGIVDGYEFNNGTTYDPEDLKLRYTWSVYSLLKAAGLNIMINPAIQHGVDQQGRELMAWYFRTDITAKPASKTTTTLGAEIFSGNNANNTNSSKHRAFDYLYGAGHLNNGFMDYFTNIPVHTRAAGLVNIFAKNTLKINTQSTFDAHIHLFWLQNNYNSGGETINKYLGTELDFTYGYKVNEFTSMLAGFSWMFGSDSMEIIRSGSNQEPAYFVYLMLRIRPRLFQHNG